MRKYQALAHRTAYLITADAAEAEDVTQAGFIKAYRALHRFRSGAPFRPWLLTIVANEAAQELLSAVNGLRERDRAVIVLRYFLDLSESEMAQVLGCSPGTVNAPACERPATCPRRPTRWGSAPRRL